MFTVWSIMQSVILTIAKTSDEKNW